MTQLSTTSPTEERALSLLGQGCGPELVASAIGVSVSRISQLLSTPEFAEKVAELRFAALARHNERDQRADRIEDLLLEKLENVIPYITDPMKLIAAYTRINAAKRRGSSSPEAITAQTQVVALNIPAVVINQHIKQDITVNINNQVIKAGNQDLITVQSANMEKLLARSKSLAPLSNIAEAVMLPPTSATNEAQNVP
jgi:hypothetical protein